MQHQKSSEFKSQSDRVVSGALDRAGRVEKLRGILRDMFKPRFDPTRLTPAQRRDVGIDQGDVDRFEVLRRPLIK